MNTQQTYEKPIAGKLPEKKFRAGAISAAVWVNTTLKDGQEVVFKTISLERGYKDKEGNWQNTQVLRTSDLPKVNVVLQKAYEYLVLKDQPVEGVI